jgi:hypothetical protein
MHSAPCVVVRLFDVCIDLLRVRVVCCRVPEQVRIYFACQAECRSTKRQVGTQACIDLLGAVKLAEKFLNGGVVQAQRP